MKEQKPAAQGSPEKNDPDAGREYVLPIGGTEVSVRFHGGESLSARLADAIGRMTD